LGRRLAGAGCALRDVSLDRDRGLARAFGTGVGLAGGAWPFGGDVCQRQCGAFFHGGPACGPADAQLPCLVDGPGTRAALLAAGWPEGLIDSPDEDSPQFDSEALWALVAQRVQVAVAASPSRPTVLIVRGADAHGQLAGRDWLALQLESAGLQVLQAVAYVRQAPELTAAEQNRARQAVRDGSAWLFSSSEAAQHLAQACPDLPLAQARALATHPRIAQRLQQAGWGRVDLVPAAVDAQADSIKSLA